MATITFIMPVFNAELYLREAIDSLLTQTSPLWKLICVDDGSTDRSAEIIKEYIKKDNRISLLVQNNSGPGVARAYAIENLQTDYCAILDADDLIEKNYVEIIIARINETRADIITPEALYVSEEREKIECHFEKLGIPCNLIISGGEEAFSLTLPWKLHGWQVMTKTIAQEYYTKEGVSYSRFNSDEYITRLLYLKSKKIALSSAIYIHRINPSSITQKVSMKRMDYLVSYYKTLLLVEQENLSVRAKQLVFNEFLIEIVTLKQMIKWLSIDDQVNAEKIIRDYYYKFKSHFSLNMLYKTSIKEKLKYLLLMSSYWSIQMFVYSRRLRQK